MPKIIQIIPAEGWAYEDMSALESAKVIERDGFHSSHARLVAFALVEYKQDGDEWEDVEGIKSWSDMTYDFAPQQHWVRVDSLECVEQMDSADGCDHWHRLPKTHPNSPTLPKAVGNA